MNFNNRIYFNGRPSQDEQETAKRKGYPLTLSLSLGAKGSRGRICDLACEGCYAVNLRNDSCEKFENKKKLSMEDACEIIKKFKNIGGKYVITAGPGEPFLDSLFYNRKTFLNKVTGSLFPLLDYAVELGLHWTFFTNMTALYDETLANELVKRKDNLSVIGKLHTLNPELHDKLVGGKGKYSKINCVRVGNNEYIPIGLHNLIKNGFQEVKKELGKSVTNLGVEVNMFKQNYKDIPRVTEWCVENGIYPNIEGLEIAGDAIQKESKLKLSSKEKVWLENKLEGILGKEFFYDRIGTTDFCYSFQGLTLDQYGNAKVCFVVDDMAEYNVKKYGVKGVWYKIEKTRSKITDYVESQMERDICLLPECRLGILASKLPKRLFLKNTVKKK